MILFEDRIQDILTGDAKRIALDFAAYVKANEMTAGGDHGEVTYKDKVVCYVHMDGNLEKPGPWTIWPDGDFSAEYHNVPMSEEMKEITWAHVNYCGNCGAGCSPGSRKVIFGKDFDNVCGSVMAFCDPDAEALECVKELLKMRRCAIDEQSV